MMLPLGTLLLAASAPIMGLAAQPGQVAVPRVELLGWGVTGWRDEPPRSDVPAGSLSANRLVGLFVGHP